MANMIFTANTYTNQYTPTEIESPLTGLFFKPNGLVMYCMDASTSKTIFQYTLSTAWDVSTAVYASKSFNVSSEDSNLFGMFFKSDGLSLYVMGRINHKVFQYTLSTAWDVSTAVYASKSLTISVQSLVSTGLFFKSDGLSLYVIDYDVHKVFQYTLSTAWDVSTAVYASKSFDTASQSLTPAGLFFNTDGSLMYIMDHNSRYLYLYTLSTAWDVSTASYDRTLVDVITYLTKGASFYFSSFALTANLIFADFTGKKVYKFVFSTFTWESGRTFPIDATGELNVVMDYTEGKQIYAYDKGIEENIIPLSMQNIEQTDYDNAEYWRKYVSIGPKNTFVFTDENESSHTVRQMDLKNPLKEISNGIFSGTINLREEI